MNELQVVDKRSASIEPSPALSPMQELQMQIVRTGDLEKLKELRAIAKEWQEDEAKRAFIEAMACFKQETIRITKDRANKQYNSRYTSLGNLVETVTPFLSKHGLSAEWQIDQMDGVKVTCIITHRMGHSKSVAMKVPVDGSGQKNPIQQIKSSITYAKICTFESACGLASTEGGNLDDDGNGAGKQSGGEMDERAVNDYISLIEAADSQEELQTAYFKARDAATAAKDLRATEAFANAKNKRLGQLNRANGGRR